MIRTEKKTSFAQKTAFLLILLPMSVIGYTMLLFAIGIPMSAYNAVVPIAAIAIYSVIRDRQMLVSLALNLIILTLWILICISIFDSSYDGMYYHKEAVITLAKGWNPLFQSCYDVDSLNGHADLALWLDNYPKGIWICSAAIYILTDFIESAKAINIVFLLLLFSTAFDSLKKVFKIRGPKNWIISLIFCLNPVFMYQLFTSYNDLAVGALIMTAALLGMKIYHGCAGKYDFLTLAGICAISCLVKFTAPLLVGLTLLAYGIGYLVKLIRGNVMRKAVIERFKAPICFIFAGFIAGTVLFGFDPYIKHLANGQNLVYPVMGEGKYDIMNENPPEGFDKLPGAVKYFLSLASKTDDEKGVHYRLKIPFTISSDELTSLAASDIRLGGFGVLFSGILLVAITIAVLARLSGQKMKPELFIGLVLFVALGLFFPESWWARYASYTYYIPVFLLMYASECPKTKLASFAAALLVIANSVITLVCVISANADMTAYVNKMLDEIKAEGKQIEIRINDFPSHIKLFEEKGIKYKIASDTIPNEIVFLMDTKYRFLN